MEWSDQQRAIYAWFATGEGNLVIGALAGTGKSTSVVHGVGLAPEQRVLMTAFNKSAAVDLTTKVKNPRCEVKTLHGLAFTWVRRAWPTVKVDNDRGVRLVREAGGADMPGEMISLAAKLAGLCKNIYPLGADHATIVALAQDFDCVPDAEWSEDGWNADRVARVAAAACDGATVNDGTVDFDDMLFVPLALNLCRAWYDLVVIDECQDCNPAQLLLAQRALRGGGRLCVVGDRNQAIYGFRGADSDSLDNLKRAYNAAELGLTITRRCPRVVVDAARVLVPDFEAAPDAPLGEWLTLTPSALPDDVKEGNAVLSRKNAPLASTCLRILRTGKRAKIEGRDIARMLVSLVKKLAKGRGADSMPDLLARLGQWEKKQCERWRAAEKPAKVEEVVDTAETIRVISDGLTGVPELCTRIEALFADDVSNLPCVVLSSIHRCVHPRTIVETTTGLMRIAGIPDSGEIAGPFGSTVYHGKMTLPEDAAIEIVSRSNYSLTVTPEHGMTTFRGDHVRVEAKDLKIGDWLRLRLGCTIDPPEEVALPALPAGNVRATRCSAPATCGESAAELFGLVVADGTVYRAGFRLVKRYRSVVDRFAQLVTDLTGISPLVGRRTDCDAWVCDVNSTLLSEWLTSIGGMSPNEKDVPACILASPLRVQAKFFRGLFEDGTVNEKDGVVDHIHWDNKSADMVRTVQIMLLRFGLVSQTALDRPTRSGHVISTLYLYGQNAKRFGELIGFVAPEKNARLNGRFAVESHHSIPVTHAEVDSLRAYTTISQRQNGRHRLLWSRDTARKIAALAGDAGAFLTERLGWHYERIEALRPTTCPAMCVEVPDGNRFLQNGFDGWNSKGREWEKVYLLADTLYARKDADAREERNLHYVAITRSKHTLVWVTEKGAPPPAKEPVPVAPVVVAEPPATPPPPPLSASALREALTADAARIEALTAAGAVPSAPNRYVIVRAAEFTELLRPHGFIEDAAATRKTGQRVLVRHLSGGETLLVYTTIPPGEDCARDVGEDSIKVTILGSNGKPLMKRQPYACRTHGWRNTLASRIDTALAAALGGI